MIVMRSLNHKRTGSVERPDWFIRVTNLGSVVCSNSSPNYEMKCNREGILTTFVTTINMV